MNRSRINVRFDGKEPGIDNISTMQELGKSQNQCVTKASELETRKPLAAKQPCFGLEKTLPSRRAIPLR